jgi:hypothetical protein
MLSCRGEATGVPGGAKHPQKVRLAPPEKFLLAPPSPQAKSNFWPKCVLLQGNTESIKVILPVNLLEDNENCSFVWKKFICCVALFDEESIDQIDLCIYSATPRHHSSREPSA